MFAWITERFLSPKHFYETSQSLLTWLIPIFLILFSYGVYAGLFLAPADYQQGDGFRIIYVHVPSAFTAMAIYAVMAVCGVLTLVWRLKIAAICMSVSAGIGATFTALALISGSIWGKPMWGTWWIWDARLTSVLILFFLYLGFIGLQALMPVGAARDRATSILSMVGAINLPIIHYSVIWWNTLHQGPTISQFAAPSIAKEMLYPLLAMILAFLLFYSIILILRMQTQILSREWRTTWVKQLL